MQGAYLRCSWQRRPYSCRSASHRCCPTSICIFDIAQSVDNGAQFQMFTFCKLFSRYLVDRSTMNTLHCRQFPRLDSQWLAQVLKQTQSRQRCPSRTNVAMMVFFSQYLRYEATHRRQRTLAISCQAQERRASRLATETSTQLQPCESNDIRTGWVFFSNTGFEFFV